MLQQLSDPFMIRALLIFAVVLALTMLLSWALATLNEKTQNRVPAFRRELEAAYASFRRFLMTVRAVAVRSLYE
jgi:nitrate/nitrite-specific signal transduction histidine kinase